MVCFEMKSKSHSLGGAVIAYIFINKSMRRAIIELIRNPFGSRDPSRTSKVHSAKSAVSQTNTTKTAQASTQQAPEIIP